MTSEVLVMDLNCGPESWRRQGVPPMFVLQGALELLNEQAPAASPGRRTALTKAVEAMEALALCDLKMFTHPSSKPVPLNVARTIVLSYQMAIGVLEQGLLADEIQEHAQDLLARYGRSLDAALRSAKQAHAVISAAIENIVGERRGETVEERLTRAVASAQRTPPIDLGDFTHHVDQEEA